MSDLSSAATLSMKIDTGAAKQELGELKSAYELLRRELANGLKAVGGSAELVASLKTSQAEVESLKQKIAGLKTSSSQMWISYSAEMEQGRVGAKKALENMTSDQVIALSKQQQDLKDHNAKIGKAHTEALALDKKFNSDRLAVITSAHAEALNMVKLDQERQTKAYFDGVAERQAILNAAHGEALALQRIFQDHQAALYFEGVKKQQAMDKEAVIWASKSRAEQLRAALPASRAISAGTDASLVHSTGAVNLAGQLGSTAAIEAELKSLAVAQAGVGAAARVAGDHQLHWNKTANEAHALARGLSGSLGTLWMTYGSIAPLLAGAALGGAFVQAAKAGAEFAYQLTFVKALGGETAAAVEMVGGAALSLSKDSLYGPVELANGLRILSQAGLSATESMKALPQATDLATVGEMSMEQAAVTLTGVMNAFNLSIADMPHIGDVFAKAAALSQTSVVGMTESMKTASVVGEQYSVSMEDTATALTMLAKVNITGTAAGTSFRNMVKEIYAPVPQAAAAFKKLGLDTKDATGNLRPFADVIYDLKDKLEQFDKAGQVQILQRMFGERGAKEAVAMLAKTREEWDKLKEAVSNSDGFMDGVTRQLEGTAKGQWKQAINTLQVDLIQAFKDAEPVLVDITNLLKSMFASEEFKSGLSRAVTGMSNVVELLLRLGPTILTAAEVWLVYKSAMVGATVWTAASAGVSGLMSAMLGLSGVMGPGLTTMAATRGVLGGLASALTMIPTPLTVVAGLLAGGAAAWMLWGDAASRAGDKAYDSAKRAEEALARLNRVKKYGTGDIGTAREELDKAEKILSLRVEARASGTTLEDARAAVYKWQAAVDQMEAELAPKEAAKEAKKSGVTRDVSEILGGKGKGSGKPGRDYDYNVEKSAIEDLKAAQQNKIAILESARSNGLISEEKYRQGLAGIDSQYDSLFEAQYTSALARLKGISDSDSSDKGKQALDHYNQMLTGYKKYLSDKELSLIKSSDREAGIVKAANDKMKLTLAQAQADADAIIAKARADKLKLSMTPAQSAAYDAGVSFDDRYRSKQAEASEELQRLERDGIDKTSERYRAQLRVVEELTAGLAEKRAEVTRNTEAAAEESRSFEYGWKSAYKQYQDDSANSAARASDAFKTASGYMEDAMVRFTTTGKLAYKDMATSILKYIAEIAAKQAASGLMSLLGSYIGSIAGAYLGGSSGNIGAGETVVNNASTYSTPVAAQPSVTSYELNALGGVYDSPSLSSYSSKIYDSPQVFAFAKGAGVFAEAGPEAIMPLARNSQGQLGVRTQGGGGGDVFVEVVVHVDGNGKSSQDSSAKGNDGQDMKKLGEMIAAVTKNVIVDEMRNGGILSSVNGR